MKNIFEELVNSVDAKTDALTFVKRSFAGIFETETGINLKEHVKPNAFESDALPFDEFCDLLGFVHFQTESKKYFDSIEEAEDIDFQKLQSMGQSSHDLIIKMRKQYDLTVLTVLAAVVKALGHDSQIVELKNTEEIKKQLKELEEEEGNA